LTAPTKRKAPVNRSPPKPKAPAPDNLPRLYPLALSRAEIVRPELMLPPAALTDPFGEGARALAIAEELRITEGEHAGRRFGDVAMQWQRDLIVAIHGHRDADRGRIIRRVFLRTSRKSGKTSLAAILGLLELILTREGRAQVVCLASSRDQSRLVFRHASAMVGADPFLKKRMKVVDYTHRIVDGEAGHELKAFASEGAAGLMWYHLRIKTNCHSFSVRQHPRQRQKSLIFGSKWKMSKNSTQPSRARVRPLFAQQTNAWGYGAELRDPDGYPIYVWDEKSMAANS
jgi:hypothetical protein